MLKDFKSLMAEKSETRNIKLIKRTVLSLGVILVTLISLDFVYKNLLFDDVNIGSDAIYQSQMRLN